MSVAKKPPTATTKPRKREKKPVQAVVRAMSGAPEPKTVMGPPTKFTKALFDDVCKGISLGKTLEELLKRPGMPARRTFQAWCESDEKLAADYARARSYGFDSIADETIAISDGATPEDVQVAKLRVDTRRWLLSKWDPKRYGDRTIVSGDGDNPIAVSLSAAILSARARLKSSTPPAELGDDGE